MSLATAHKQGPPAVRKGPPCTICALLESLPDSERAALRAMLDDRTGTWANGQDIVRELDRQLGFRTSNVTLNRHRRGECWGERVRRGAGA